MKQWISGALAPAVLSGALLWTDAAAAADTNALRFTASPAQAGEFVFDTGALRGKLRAGGKSQGLTEVYESTTGARVDRSMGLAGHYRVFTANRRFGNAAWEWPSEATLNADGTVRVVWPAATNRPFELQALYRWAKPNALDVETTVVAREPLARFESFFANYFAPEFDNAQVWLRGSADRPPGPNFLVVDRTYGDWMAFPRDRSVVEMIQDGRWDIEPNPVKWRIMPNYARPLGLRRAAKPNLTAAVMAHPDDCFAVLSPYQTEPHYSLYLSLFGRDLQPGQTNRARTRILIQPNLAPRDAARAYESYLLDLPGQ